MAKPYDRAEIDYGLSGTQGSRHEQVPLESRTNNRTAVGQAPIYAAKAQRLAAKRKGGRAHRARCVGGFSLEHVSSQAVAVGLALAAAVTEAAALALLVSEEVKPRMNTDEH